MAAHPVDAALFAKLRTDTGAGGVAALATGGIWRDEAPQNVAPFVAGGPMVLVKMQTEEDLHSFGSRRPVEDALFSIDAISKNNDTVAEAMFDRIDALLDPPGSLATMAITGHTLTHCERQERFAYLEAEGDERWHHRGGIYRIEAVKN
jgi:hypothetical protein